MHLMVDHAPVAVATGAVFVTPERLDD